MGKRQRSLDSARNMDTLVSLHTSWSQPVVCPFLASQITFHAIRAGKLVASADHSPFLLTNQNELSGGVRIRSAFRLAHEKSRLVCRGWKAELRVSFAPNATLMLCPYRKRTCVAKKWILSIGVWPTGVSCAPEEGQEGP